MDPLARDGGGEVDGCGRTTHYYVLSQANETLKATIKKTKEDGLVNGHAITMT